MQAEFDPMAIYHHGANAAAWTKDAGPDPATVFRATIFRATGSGAFYLPTRRSHPGDLPVSAPWMTSRSRDYVWDHEHLFVSARHLSSGGTVLNGIRHLSATPYPTYPPAHALTANE
jgi:hypothetical protein